MGHGDYSKMAAEELVGIPRLVEEEKRRRLAAALSSEAGQGEPAQPKPEPSDEPYASKEWFENHVKALAAVTSERDDLKAALAKAQAVIDEDRKEQGYIRGFNAGFAEAEYQRKHGKPSP